MFGSAREIASIRRGSTHNATKTVLYRTFGSKDQLIVSILERVTEAFLSIDSLQIEKYGDRLHRYLEVSRKYENSMRILLLQSPYDEKYNKHYKKLSRQLVRRQWSGLNKDKKPVKQNAALVLSSSACPSCHSYWIQFHDG